MDYISSKSMTRQELREFSCYIRKKFGYDISQSINGLNFLDKLISMFDDKIFYVIQDDALFPSNCPTYIDIDIETYMFKIHISETVYKNAVNGKADALSFLVHECCHFLLIEIKKTIPISNCGMKYGQIKRYESCEWQCMCLTGELIIPYEKCSNMSKEEIMKKYNSTSKSTDFFLEYVANNIKKT